MSLSILTEAKGNLHLWNKKNNRLTWKCANVMIVMTAALAENTVHVTSAAGNLIIKGLVTSVSAGRLGDD